MPSLSHDGRLLLFSLIAGFPAVVTSLVLLWTGEYSSKIEWTVTLVILGFWFGCSLALKNRAALPLQTIANLLAALREGDYSIRARGARLSDALGQVFVEVNALSQTLREQRRGAVEAGALLRAVMVEIDVAVFTFDGDQRLQLINRAGENLLRKPMEQLRGLSAADLDVADCLEGKTPRTVEIAFPGGAGRWEIRRSAFRERGMPHQLLVLADLSRALREEEQIAWRRLVRVLGHELNNSLAPIRSIAGSLERLVRRHPMPDDWQEDMARGLGIITTRADGLGRFMSGYARMATLPPPEPASFAVDPWIRRVAGLEVRMPALVTPGPDMAIHADAGQLEQALINLLNNAVDASLETGGQVTLGWEINDGHLEIWIRDEGPGLSNTANLFVPFFTTKPGGSGIGLALSRQIVETHGGLLTLENRKDRIGCEARIRLPL